MSKDPIRSGKRFLAIILSAAVLLCSAAVLILLALPKETCLVLKNNDTGVHYAHFPVEEGDTFSVTFIHSVNQSPVIERYVIENGEIYVTELQYYAFGAGMPTDLGEGQTLSYAEDGGMVISGFHEKSTDMIYVVGMVSDHILDLHENEYSLRDICGRGSAVTFTVKKLPAFLAEYIK